jgi:hypothetical protein
MPSQKGGGPINSTYDKWPKGTKIIMWAVTWSFIASDLKPCWKCQERKRKARKKNLKSKRK